MSLGFPNNLHARLVSRGGKSFRSGTIQNAGVDPTRRLMYERYFGFLDAPFGVTPDPSFFYSNPLYKEVFDALLYGIKAKTGLIVMTGEVGTGKTTLLRKLLDNFEATIQSVFIFNPNLAFDEMLQVITNDLGLASENKTTLGMIQELTEHLRQQAHKGGTVCLLIDEAQCLSDEALEGLPVLLDLEAKNERVLQIVLSGQPELDAKLTDRSLGQLKERIALRYHLESLTQAEIGAYVRHRLKVAGYEGPEIFSEQAIKSIWDYSRGVPRLINIICDNALLLAYSTNRRIISTAMVDEVALDLQLERGVAKTKAPTATTVSKKDREPAADKPRPPALTPVGSDSREHPGEPKTMSPEQERILQVIPTEKTVFRITDPEEKRNRLAGVPRVGWRVLNRIDGSRDVQGVAEILGVPYAYTAKIIFELHQLGLVEVVPASTERPRDSAPPEFFDRMTRALTEAMGPLAAVVIWDQIAALGESRESFPKRELGELVESVGREILDETMKVRFRQSMFEEIVVLTTECSSFG